MNVSLTPELESLVEQKVASGFYQTASEVVREGLRLLVERDRVREARLESLRADVAVGIKQLDDGEFAALNEQVSARIRAGGRAKLVRK